MNIGSSQDFRLGRALVVYGKSSYEGYPYRHPFVTLHEVIHDGDVARLAEGQLMTPQMLIDLMAGLGKIGSSRDLAGASTGAHRRNDRVVDCSPPADQYSSATVATIVL